MNESEIQGIVKILRAQTEGSRMVIMVIADAKQADADKVWACLVTPKTLDHLGTCSNCLVGLVGCLVKFLERVASDARRQQWHAKN